MQQGDKERPDSELSALVRDYEKRSAEESSIFFGEEDFARLIDYYEEAQFFNRAIIVADLALNSHPYSESFYIRKAQLLLSLHREEEVLVILDQAANYAPGSLEILLLRAETLAYLDRISEAYQIIKLAKDKAESPEERSDALVVEALINEQSSDFPAMFNALVTSLRLNHVNEEALARVWLASELAQKYQESIKLHEWIIDQAPYSHQAWYNLGHAQASLGHLVEAMEAYEYAFIINDKFEEAYLEYAEICFTLRRFHRAIQCYREMEERFEPDSEVYLRMGQCYQQLEQYKSAVVYFEKAIKMDPDNEEVLYALGENYSLQEMWQHALRYYRMAIRLDDQQETFHVSAGLAAQNLGDSDRAEHHFLSAVRIAPQLAHVWSPFAFFLVEENRWAEAETLLQEAAQHCNDTEVDYCQIACLFMANRHQQACQLLGEVLARDYEGHDLLLSWMPDLIDDPKVSALLYTYRP